MDKSISVWHFVSYHHPYKRTTAQGSILRCDSDQGNVNGASQGKTLRNRTGRNLQKNWEKNTNIFFTFLPKEKKIIKINQSCDVCTWEKFWPQLVYSMEAFLGTFLHSLEWPAYVCLGCGLFL